MSCLWSELERGFNEQIAGITPPKNPTSDDADTRARLREATPLPSFQPHQPTEL